MLLCLLALVLSVRANDNGLGLTPALGWSTWCTMGRCGNSASVEQHHVAAPGASYHDVCNQAEILDVAAAMVSNGMQKIGYEWIILDDCWAWTERTASGELQGDPQRFPDGMATFVGKVRALGFKVGLYTSCGATTCSSGGRPKPIPGSYGHYEQDAQTFADWKVDYMKFDYCDWHFNTTVLIPEMATRKMYEALNKTGRPIWFNFHCVPIPPTPLGWCNTYGNSYRVWSDHHDNWESTTSIINFLADEWIEGPGGQGPGSWPDADFVMTGGAGCNNATPGMRCPGQTDEEYRTEFAMWAMAGGQMVVSSDVRNMSALQKEILLNTEILDVLRDPLGKIGRRVRHSGTSSVWSVPLEKKCAAVALLNQGTASASITAPFSSLHMGWSSKTTLAVRDLWARKDLPKATGELEKTVQSHQTLLFKLCE